MADEGEVWVNSYSMRAGSTVVRIERQYAGDTRDADKWVVEAPRETEHYGSSRWFDHLTDAQAFAGRMAYLIEQQRKANNEAVSRIRDEWATFLKEPVAS